MFSECYSKQGEHQRECLCRDEAVETPFLLGKSLCFNVGERVDEEKVRARGSYFFLTEWEGLLVFFAIYC